MSKLSIAKIKDHLIPIGLGVGIGILIDYFFFRRLRKNTNE